MPICFARLEFVKRSAGKNICSKAAYNLRDKISFQGNEFFKAHTYDWSHKGCSAYHEILLPTHVDKSFKSPEVLWNAVEQKENRKNSQLALEMVLALPDDKVISVEDRIHLSKTFVEENFVKNGLVAQVDIHSPEPKKGTNPDEPGDHNWHAHVLVTTRRFKENGKEFENHKARDLMPIMRGGRVVSGPRWGELWAQHQNQFFEDKGLSLRVDVNGAVPQIHLGPVRMRGRAFSLLRENEQRIELNTLTSEEPSKILEKLTDKVSVFSKEDVETFLDKHINPANLERVRADFWTQKGLVQLLDKESKNPLNKFTSQEVLEEERKIVRLSEKMYQRDAFRLRAPDTHPDIAKKLTAEQTVAFNNILQGQKMSCVEGHAGTGKSHLLLALKKAYELEGYTMRAFGPDSATAKVLSDKGFSSSENIYRFLFAEKHGHRDLKKEKEVWVVDEAGKLGNRPLLEFLKLADKKGVQVVLSGCSSQLASVDRGGMFQVLCEKFGAQYLEDIQRQKQEEQRTTAKKLASGKMSEALDRLANQGSLRWVDSKEEAVESLVRKWALDRTYFPNNSSLMIAHSNREVRTLNEMVRQFKREAGELGEKEFECDTPYGKIFVSEGDTIEFRKNDSKLGITNGMTGVLIKASKEKFVIHKHGEGKGRKIVIDPRKNRNFQLGYATTYYRSQGKTVDRAYVLHSPMMNKEMFYVGLTRHVHQAEIFVSKTETKNLAELKAQSYRAGHKEKSLDSLTQADLDRQEARAEKEAYLKDLKSSGSVVDNLKGAGLSLWDKVRTKSSSFAQAIDDRKANRDFFNPKVEPESKVATPIREVAFLSEKEAYEKVDAQPIMKEVSKIKNSIESASAMPEKEILPKSDPFKLSDPKKGLLQSYYKSVAETSSLYAAVQHDNKSRPEWLQGCAERNTIAYQVVEAFKSKELKATFDAKGLEILQDRSERHESVLQKQEASKVDYDSLLKEKLDGLLWRLFPEGPTRSDSKGLRFGAKGSLAVTCNGAKAGCFFDFESHEGGGPLQLIQRVTGGSYAESIGWAKEFLGEPYSNPLPRHRVFFKKEAKEQEWVSLKPSPSATAPSLRELSKGLEHHYKEKARYTYRDADGGVLFHTVRLEEKNDSGKKMVLPVSYGYYRGNRDHPQWALKMYSAQNRSLYNQHLIKEHPQAKILIVEGEKTADAASKLFASEKMICLSWSGGAGAVSKSDWTPIRGREVVLWPDNDSAGFKAAEDIGACLRKVGVKSLRVVDRELLKKHFPEKWDLADPVPEGKDPRLLNDMLLRSNEKAVGIGQLHTHLQGVSCSIYLANEVLWRVDERMRPSLEKKGDLRDNEVNRAILGESAKVLRGRGDLTAQLKKEHGFSEELAARVSCVSLLHRASSGKESSHHTIQEMKEVVSKIGGPSLTKEGVDLGEREMSFLRELSESVHGKRFVSERVNADKMVDLEKDISIGDTFKKVRGLSKNNDFER